MRQGERGGAWMVEFPVFYSIFVDMGYIDVFQERAIDTYDIMKSVTQGKIGLQLARMDRMEGSADSEKLEVSRQCFHKIIREMPKHQISLLNTLCSPIEAGENLAALRYSATALAKQADVATDRLGKIIEFYFDCRKQLLEAQNNDNLNFGVATSVSKI
jgi:hypothetical protein